MVVLSQPAPIVFPNRDPGQVAVRTITLDGVDQPPQTQVQASVPFTFFEDVASVGLSASFEQGLVPPSQGEIVNDSPDVVSIEVSEPTPINGFNDRWSVTITVTTL